MRLRSVVKMKVVGIRLGPTSQPHQPSISPVVRTARPGKRSRINSQHACTFKLSGSCQGRRRHGSARRFDGSLRAEIRQPWIQHPAQIGRAGNPARSPGTRLLWWRSCTDMAEGSIDDACSNTTTDVGLSLHSYLGQPPPTRAVGKLRLWRAPHRNRLS
jgi:hypothetical protein